jgi:hypothetical protein
MAFNPNPTGYFSGILNIGSGESVSTSGVFIPHSSLESYNASTSGDIRQLMYSMIESYADKYASLAVADRPSQLTVSRASSVPTDNVVRKTYTFTVNLDFGNLSVTEEN